MTQGLKHLLCNTKTQVRILSAQGKLVCGRWPILTAITRRILTNSTFSEEFSLRKYVENNRR